MSEAMREAFEALEQLQEIADDHPGMFRAVPELAGKVRAGLDEALREYVGANNEAALSGAQQGEAEPYGYLREVDGRVQLSMGAECPPNRSGGMATPWEAVYTAPQPAQVPKGWRLVPVEPTTEMLGEGAIALFAQSREPLSSAYRNMLAAAPRCPMLTAAPSGDAKREAEDSHECRRAELARRVRARVIVNAIKAAGYEDWMYAPVEVSKAVERLNDCGLLLDGDEEAARLRQSSDGDDSEEKAHG